MRDGISFQRSSNKTKQPRCAMCVFCTFAKRNNSSRIGSCIVSSTIPNLAMFDIPLTCRLSGCEDKLVLFEEQNVIFFLLFLMAYQTCFITNIIFFYSSFVFFPLLFYFSYSVDRSVFLSGPNVSHSHWRKCGAHKAETIIVTVCSRNTAADKISIRASSVENGRSFTFFYDFFRRISSNLCMVFGFVE